MKCKTRQDCKTPRLQVAFTDNSEFAIVMGRRAAPNTVSLEAAFAKGAAVPQTAPKSPKSKATAKAQAKGKAAKAKAVPSPKTTPKAVAKSQHKNMKVLDAKAKAELKAGTAVPHQPVPPAKRKELTDASNNSFDEAVALGTNANMMDESHEAKRFCLEKATMEAENAVVDDMLWSQLERAKEEHAALDIEMDTGTMSNSSSTTLVLGAEIGKETNDAATSAPPQREEIAAAPAEALPQGGQEVSAEPLPADPAPVGLVEPAAETESVSAPAPSASNDVDAGNSSALPAAAEPSGVSSSTAGADVAMDPSSTEQTEHVQAVPEPLPADPASVGLVEPVAETESVSAPAPSASNDVDAGNSSALPAAAEPSGVSSSTAGADVAMDLSSTEHVQAVPEPLPADPAPVGLVEPAAETESVSATAPSASNDVDAGNSSALPAAAEPSPVVSSGTTATATGLSDSANDEVQSSFSALAEAHVAALSSDFNDAGGKLKNEDSAESAECYRERLLQELLEMTDDSRRIKLEWADMHPALHEYNAILKEKGLREVSFSGGRYMGGFGINASVPLSEFMAWLWEKEHDEKDNEQAGSGSEAEHEEPDGLEDELGKLMDTFNSNEGETRH